MKTFIDFAMNENDKRLLIVLLFILVFLFLIIGLIGALIRLLPFVLAKEWIMNYMRFLFTALFLPLSN